MPQNVGPGVGLRGVPNCRVGDNPVTDDPGYKRLRVSGSDTPLRQHRLL